MPHLTSIEIKKAISDGRLSLLTLDTSIFIQYQIGLEHGLLRRLSQFADSEVDFILSDVVINEISAHMLAAIEKGDKQLKDAIKESGSARNLSTTMRQSVIASITTTETPKECASRRLIDFQTHTNFTVASTARLVSADDLFSSYFDLKPPFENKDNKKHEFPDAMALLGLEAYAKKEAKLLLAVSADKGWREFCLLSDWLVYERELDVALSLFQSAASVVGASFSKRLIDDDAARLVPYIEAELAQFVDGMEIYIDASASFYFETELDTKEYLSFKFRDGPTLKLVDQDEEEELFVFQTAIDVDMIVSSSFYFQVRDDGEYFTIGDTYQTKNFDQKMSIAITICGDPTGDYDVIEIEVLDYEKWVDFGQIEPGYDEEIDE
jgi:hypothetical protein